jgi:adenylate kinase
MEKQTIIFIGPQGCGKGTQIELLSKVLNEIDPENRIVDIQTGRQFRALAEAEGKENFTIKKVKETLDKGILQPLFLTVSLWGKEFIEQADSGSHMMIDGLPRRVVEAKVLDSALEFYERGNLTVVYLDTNEEEVLKRMRLRARSDDTEESIKTRLEAYQKETLPVLEYYRNRPSTNVIDIDGSKDIEEVHSTILSKLNIIK